MHKQEFSVALPEEVNKELRLHLMRSDMQEDLAFALWTPSYGHKRLTALVHTPIYPHRGDRQVHGNVSFNRSYFERVCEEAVKQGFGIAFLHSHPAPGWQGMSDDDVRAEKKIVGAVGALTDLPLLGMTVGSDGTWSARMWEAKAGKRFERRWCVSVRSAGKRLQVDFTDSILPPPIPREHSKRTATVWGAENHVNLSRLRIGIVGLGSVGSIVAETLARMGMSRFVLIDYDVIKTHNLDRQLGAVEGDLGIQKVVVAERQIKSSATAAQIEVATVPFSLAEEEGYRAALDCDVIFSCVDRPRARSILNHFAYAHLIPVIDGGIGVWFKDAKFSAVDWQAQTVAPGRPCLECLKAFNQGDASTEAEGKLDDPSYFKGLPSNHRLKRNENVMPFSMNLASLEVLQFIALATGAAGIDDFGVQRFRYNPGIIEPDIGRECLPSCETVKLTAKGDKFFSLMGRDFGADAVRTQEEKKIACHSSFPSIYARFQSFWSHIV